MEEKMKEEIGERQNERNQEYIELRIEKILRNT